MTAISTRPLVTTGVDLDALPQRKATGVSSQWVFLFIPLGGRPTLEEAVDDALADGGGDLLLNPVTYTSSWWFLFGRATIEIDGQVVDTSAAPMNEPVIDETSDPVIDEAGDAADAAADAASSEAEDGGNDGN